MNLSDSLIAVTYFAGGILIWPIFRIFWRRADGRARWLRKIFLYTLSVLLALGTLLGVVALLGRFNHNWLPMTLLFPLINLVSMIVSIVGMFSRHENEA